MRAKHNVASYFRELQSICEKEKESNLDLIYSVLLPLFPIQKECVNILILLLARTNNIELCANHNLVAAELQSGKLTIHFVFKLSLMHYFCVKRKRN